MNLQNDMTRRVAAALLCAGLMLGVSGCRHRMKVATLPPILKPVALVDVPRPAKEPMLEAPHIKMPPEPISAAMARFPRERRRQVVRAAPPVAPPPTPTPEPVTEATAIGALTAGGPENPQTRQDAAELIASNERRLSGLSAQKAEAEKAQISTVKNFQRQAQEAMSSGDAEGAKTLAVKAKLLLDDLEK